MEWTLTYNNQTGIQLTRRQLRAVLLMLLVAVLLPTTLLAHPTATRLLTDSINLVRTPQGGLRLTMTVRPKATDDKADRRQTLICVPRLTDAEGRQADFPAVALMQPLAYRHYNRSAHRQHPAAKAALQLRADRADSLYHYTCSITYADWMSSASLTLVTIDTRCCESSLAARDTLIATLGTVGTANYAALAQRPDTTLRLDTWRPLLALKTNLLFDALLAPNLEVEVPLGRSRWSLMAEWWTPWYRWHGPNKGNRAFELLMLGGELRYWLGSRCTTCDDVLSGHFVGIYGAGGKYDVQWDNDQHEGWQGEYASFGLTYGYVMTLAPHWNLELSVSAGYVGGPQRHYWGMFDDAHLIWKNNQDLRFVGPTKLKATLAWVIGRPNQRKQKKGGAQWL